MFKELKKVKDFVGENPHQNASLYETEDVPACSLIKAEKIFGRDLSFNDTIDTDAALALIREFADEKAVAVTFHHGNPCGVAVSENINDAFNKAIEASDSTSIIEGIIVLNGTVDEEIANSISKMFINVVVCYDITNKAIEILSPLQQLTLFKHPNMMSKAENLKEIKTIVGGYLVQSYNDMLVDKLETISSRKPSEEEIKQLMIAWKIAKHTKTNAIVLVKNNASVGIGPGLNNRIWSTQQAITRAGNNAHGCVLASDAIIPLCESIEIAGKAGITAIIHPGGWYKEDENLAISEKYNMAMVTTGINQFKH